MPRKPAMLLSLLNLVLRPIAGQTSVPSNQHVALPQHPLPTDREAWRVHWQVQGQPWRAEPEIDRERQEYLAGRRAISPNIKQGIYPFKDIKLSRADVEWLLTTHKNGRGPVDWSEESPGECEGLDLRGADLRGVDLQCLPLACTRGGLSRSEWVDGATLEECKMAQVHLEKANLTQAHLERALLTLAHLEGVNLRGAHLEKSDLYEAHLEGAYLYETHLEAASLRNAFFDSSGAFQYIIFVHAKMGITLLSDVHWGGMNLSLINWAQFTILGDELEARQLTRQSGKTKTTTDRLRDYRRAVRAYRQLAVVLQEQGLNEDAARFAYRAQFLQKHVFWLQMIQPKRKFTQRVQTLGAWLFSWFLFLLAGYGYRLWRSFLAYALVIIGFTTMYYLLGASFKPSLSLVNALGLSMTSFHGRGFFPGVTQLNDTLTILASLEAFVGLILEATFIATLTQRFFGK